MTERTSPRAAPNSQSRNASKEASKRSMTERIQATLNGSTDTSKSTPPGPTVPPAPAAPVAPAAVSPRRTTRAPRRAQLRLTRIDPWSVMKTAFLLAVALGVVTVVSVFIIWSVLAAAGVWDSINKTVQDVVGGDNNSSSFDVTDYVGMSRVLGFTLLVAGVRPAASS